MYKNYKTYTKEQCIFFPQKVQNTTKNTKNAKSPKIKI